MTRAARGIGAAVAQRLAHDGLTIAAVDLLKGNCDQLVAEIEAAGGRAAMAVGCDVADEAAVVSAVGEIATALGESTVLVNNAGVIRDDLLYKMSVTDWDTVMNVHVRGSFLVSWAVQGYMTKVGWGGS